MKKSLILLILFLAYAGTACGEEMIGQGPISGKIYLSGTSKVMAMGEERIQMNYEGAGVFAADSGKGFSHLAAVHSMGTLHAVKGDFEETGFMVFTSPSGDKAFATYNGSGTLGKTGKGTWTYTGGTGKLTGIKGSGDFTRYSLQYATDGVWTTMSISKGDFKLP